MNYHLVWFEEVNLCTYIISDQCRILYMIKEDLFLGIQITQQQPFGQWIIRHPPCLKQCPFLEEWHNSTGCIFQLPPYHTWEPNKNNILFYNFTSIECIQISSMIPKGIALQNSREHQAHWNILLVPLELCHKQFPKDGISISLYIVSRVGRFQTSDTFSPNPSQLHIVL